MTQPNHPIRMPKSKNPRIFLKGSKKNLVPYSSRAGWGLPIMPFTFFLPSVKSELVARRQGALRGKSIGGRGNPLGDPPMLRKMRRAYRAPGRAPLQRNNPVRAERRDCPPGPANETRLIIFVRNPPCLRAGQCLTFIRSCFRLGKSKGGVYRIDLQGKVFYSNKNYITRSRDR